MDEKTADIPEGGLSDIKLADRYDLTKTSVLLTGAQAVARLLIAQKERDRRAGFNTGGFISGYRGSPVGGLDLQFVAAEGALQGQRHPFRARPQRGARGDRALGRAAGGDARRGPVRRRVRPLVRQGPRRRPLRRRVPPRQSRGHLAARRRARADGRRPHRRILDHRASVRIRLRRRDDAGALAGRRAGNPRLRRARLGAEPLRRRLGRHQMHQGHDRIDRRGRRLARSRRARHSRRPSRCRRAASTSARPTASSSRKRACRSTSATPWSPGSPPTRSTARSRRAARTPKIGIITAGKSYLDVRQALDDLGIDEARCNELGLRIFKLGCAWPLVPSEMRDFADGLDLIIVVEEKRSLIESAGARGALRLAASADLHRQDATKRATGCSRSRARSIPTTSRSRSASGCSNIIPTTGSLARRRAPEARADARSPRSSRRRRARPISARAARTTARP